MNKYLKNYIINKLFLNKINEFKNSFLILENRISNNYNNYIPNFIFIFYKGGGNMKILHTQAKADLAEKLIGIIRGYPDGVEFLKTVFKTLADLTELKEKHRK